MKDVFRPAGPQGPPTLKPFVIFHLWLIQMQSGYETVEMRKTSRYSYSSLSEDESLFYKQFQSQQSSFISLVEEERETLQTSSSANDEEEERPDEEQKLSPDTILIKSVSEEKRMRDIHHRSNSK